MNYSGGKISVMVELQKAVQNRYRVNEGYNVRISFQILKVKIHAVIIFFTTTNL